MVDMGYVNTKWKKWKRTNCQIFAGMDWACGWQKEGGFWTIWKPGVITLEGLRPTMGTWLHGSYKYTVGAAGVYCNGWLTCRNGCCAKLSALIYQSNHEVPVFSDDIYNLCICRSTKHNKTTSQLITEQFLNRPNHPTINQLENKSEQINDMYLWSIYIYIYIIEVHDDQWCPINPCKLDACMSLSFLVPISHIAWRWLNTNKREPVAQRGHSYRNGKTPLLGTMDGFIGKHGASTWFVVWSL